jgi:hypothetical protein
MYNSQSCLQENQMNETTKATLTNLDSWKRGLFMLVFVLISGVAKLIVTLVAVFQFITLLFKGQVNEAVLPLGQSLSTYLYQITLFLTFKTDEMPFTFLDFPDGTTKSEFNNDDIGSTESPNNNQAEAVDAVKEDIKDETEAEKESKSAPLNG